MLASNRKNQNDNFSKGKQKENENSIGGIMLIPAGFLNRLYSRLKWKVEY